MLCLNGKDMDSFQTWDKQPAGEISFLLKEDGGRGRRYRLLIPCEYKYMNFIAKRCDDEKVRFHVAIRTIEQEDKLLVGSLCKYLKNALKSALSS
ncbi:MAG: hypothetical protein HQ539_00995 [Parcubacteria group bacterium]|nr:hypothetical protein [Parcubacteria group bacterium]